MKVKLYNQQGENIGQAELPAEVFGLKMNKDLVHQSITIQAANSRKVIAHTKDRSEVRGGGKKPWKQKGTGRARHGSIRSPLWRGGGITFGPTKERVFSQKISKKMKKKALLISLSSKVKDEELVLLDKLELTEAKTKKMAELFKNLEEKIGKDFSKGTLVVLAKSDRLIIRAGRNIPKVKILNANNLNILDVLSHKYLLMPQESVKVIEKTYL